MSPSPQRFAEGGLVEGGITPVATEHACPAGYHWDETQQACVPDAQPQQSQSSGIPSNVMTAARIAQNSTSGGAAGGEAGGGGAASSAPLYTNPYAWAAAIAATAWGMEHNDISSWQNQLKGDSIRDALSSPNVKNWLKQNKVPEMVTDQLKVWGAEASLDPKRWVQYQTRPFERAFNYVQGLFN